MRRKASLLVLALGIAFASFATEATAAVYPGNKCVSDKMKTAAGHCKAVLKAWSKWEKSQDDLKRDAAFAKATAKFEQKWDKADAKAAAKGVDCADTTLGKLDVRTNLEAAIAAIVSDVNTGLTLSDRSHAKCGQKILNAAALKCDKFLKAESKHIRSLAKDADGAKLLADQAKASAKFSAAWVKATAQSCPTSATELDVEGAVDQIAADVVLNTTVSPNVPNDKFKTITHPTFPQPGHFVQYDGETIGPRCQDFSEYSFFVKRGTENKLLMYYQGGGACWNGLTCVLNLCDQNAAIVGTCSKNCTVDGDCTGAETCDGGTCTGAAPACAEAEDCPGPAQTCNGTDNPNNTFQTGFADITNPDNPFRDWHIVFVSYCSCDVHWGDGEQNYNSALGNKHVEHRGWDNARLAEKFAREHFVNPEQVFVTGSSAGAYGATLHAVNLEKVYPASQIDMLADAGNGVITQTFLVNNFPSWGAQLHLPDLDLPGVSDIPLDQQSIPNFIAAAARAYPDTRWAHYTTAFDGGTGGQGGFYHVMLNDTNNPLDALATWPNWWESICAFNEEMEMQAVDTEAAVSTEHDNYRYYIGTGSRHTMFGSNKVYTDTTGGVPTIVDWINEMMDRDPLWASVVATPDNVLLSGDPKPDPLEPPFEQQGADVVINCP